MWYVRFSAEDIRRGTFEQLQAMAAKGKLRPSMPVRAPGETQWVRADSVLDLFPVVAEEVPFTAEPVEDISTSSASSPLAASVPKPSPPSSAGLSVKAMVAIGVGGVALLALMVGVFVAVLAYRGRQAAIAARMRAPLESAPINGSGNRPVSPTSLAPPRVAPPATIPVGTNTTIPTFDKPYESGRAGVPPLDPPINVYKPDGSFDVDAFITLMRAPEPQARWATNKLNDYNASGAVEALAFSGDNKRLAAAYATGTVIVWDVATCAKISEIEPAIRGRCKAIALNSKGTQVLFGGDALRGGVVADAETGKKLFVHNAPKATITGASFSADDKLVTLCDESRSTHQYPVLGGRGSSGRFAGAEEATAIASSEKCRYAVLRSNELIITAQLGWTTLLAAQEKFPLRTSSAHLAMLSPGERYLLLCDDHYNVEIRAVDEPGFAWFVYVGDPTNALALSSDGRTLATGQGDGTIALRDFTGSTDPPGRLVARHLRDMLSAKKYDELDAIATRLEQDVTPFGWAANDSPYHAFSGAISLRGEVPAFETGTDAAIDKWGRSRPASKMAKILKTKYYITTAWAQRGSGAASTVNKGQWERFHHYIAQARDTIVPLCEMDDAPPTAFRYLFIVAKAESWPVQRWMPYWTKQFDKTPAHLDLHLETIQMLMPRWGGGPNDCRLYAAKVADKIGGPAGDAVYARIAVSQWQFYRFPDDKALDEGGYDYARVTRGLLHLMESEDTLAWAGHTGMRLAYGRKDKATTQAFSAKLKGHYREWQPGWWPHEYFFVEALHFSK
jgi:hypothetical protein